MYYYVMHYLMRRSWPCQSTKVMGSTVSTPTLMTSKNWVQYFPQSQVRSPLLGSRLSCPWDGKAAHQSSLQLAKQLPSGPNFSLHLTHWMSEPSQYYHKIHCSPHCHYPWCLTITLSFPLRRISPHLLPKKLPIRKPSTTLVVSQHAHVYLHLSVHTIAVPFRASSFQWLEGFSPQPMISTCEKAIGQHGM